MYYIYTTYVNVLYIYIRNIYNIETCVNIYIYVCDNIMIYDIHMKRTAHHGDIVSFV